MISDVWYRLRALFRRRSMESELDDELRAHFDCQVEKHVTSGQPLEEARRRARLEFGGIDQVKEECRAARGVGLIETTVQDLRYALRMLRKSPSFIAVAVVTLALGIGANTAIFSVVDGVLLAPLPYSQPDRLVAIWESNLRYKWHVWISYLNFRDWQRAAPRSLQSMAAFYFQGRDLTSPGTPEHLDGKEVSSGFFETLGVKLVLGREFTPEEDQHGGAPVVIISNHLWRDRFSGSPHVLGGPVTLDGVDYTVVGVAPAKLHFFGDAEVYTPLGQGDPSILSERAAHDNMLAIARLKPDAGVRQAQAEMSTIQNRLDQLYTDADQGLGAAVVPLKQEVVGDVSGTLLLLLGAVGLVLLIACANVASLLLARSTARMREFAIRLSLGASPARVIRQVLTESVLLSLAGAALGLLIAVWGVKPVLAMVPGSLPRREDIGLNLPVLLFALGVAIAVGILFGLAPALKASRANLQDALKEGGRTSSGAHQRAQSGLVIFQMALTLVLLAGAGLLFRTIRSLWDVNPGFDTAHLITFRVGVSPSLTQTPASTRTAYRQLLERIRNLPGIESVDFTLGLPLAGGAGTIPFWHDSQVPAEIQAAPRTVIFPTGPDYLRTMRIPLLQGRFFTPADTTATPCVVAIDSAFARTYLPGKSPLGETLSFGFEKPFIGPCTIVGVVGRVKAWGLEDRSLTQAQTYYPLYQDPDRWVLSNFAGAALIVRTRLDTAAALDTIKKAVYGIGSEQPVYDVRTMQEIASESMASQRFLMVLLGAFAGLALLLASVGIYGVISYSASRRVHELGIRMALGAGRRDVLRMVLGQGAKMALVGVALGLAAALGITRLMVNLLFGVSPHDPATLAGVAVLLVVVALTACYIPARRATRVDPMVALRCE
jgi:predicted permease